jgi:D-tyrosyl-tRNA(Tyr) deacylase
MRFVIQRVSEAKVSIEGKTDAVIGRGLMILMAIHKDDTPDMVSAMVEKILNLRIFPDDQKPINRSMRDIGGEILLVSQFTLYADLKGNRPSFFDSAKPDAAIPLYNHFVDVLKKEWPGTKTGEFGADMKVTLTNDGPVTIILG